MRNDASSSPSSVDKFDDVERMNFTRHKVSSDDRHALDYRAPGFTVGENVSTSTRVLPKRIILIRHGESQGNVDETAYQNTPDWQIRLTEKGRMQAEQTGKTLREMLEQDKREEPEK